MLKNLKHDWKKLFIIVMLGFMAIDFSGFVQEMPSNGFHVDHSYHIIKFELFDKYGLNAYSEMAKLPVFLFFPPLLIPFLFLTKILSIKFAYFLTYFLIIGISYFVSKRIIPGKKDDVLLAILFPASFMAFIRAGRILELMAHLSFIPLVYYIEKGKNRYINTGLFLAGITSHLPTAAFYSPYLFLKTLRKKEYKQLLIWGIIGLSWLLLYLPPTIGLTSWFNPRVQIIYAKTMMFFTELMGSWMVFVFIIGALVMTLSLLFFKKEDLDALPSFAMIMLTGLIYFINPELIKWIPGINQILIITAIPLFSILLLKNNEKLWKTLSLLLIPAFLFPVLWTGPTEADFKKLDLITKNYTMVNEFSDKYIASDFARNYLVHKGISTPLCPVYEYSDPDWYFFNPTSCEELDIGVEYIIMPKSYEWAKSCGEFIEGETMLIVKPL
ncbi:MAG: hypothetical protein GOU99_03120 [Candidatus Altiarchaeota archaeon]|nr:hypothetical protein [Candidatus Altiarchaeota archaeon]